MLQKLRILASFAPFLLSCIDIIPKVLHQFSLHECFRTSNAYICDLLFDCHPSNCKLVNPNVQTNPSMYRNPYQLTVFTNKSHPALVDQPRLNQVLLNETFFCSALRFEPLVKINSIISGRGTSPLFAPFLYSSLSADHLCSCSLEIS